MSDLAEPIGESPKAKRASVRESPELVMLRHNDYRRAVEKHGQAKVDVFIKKSERMVTKVAKKFWGSYDAHPNQVAFRRAGVDLEGLEQIGRIWAGGYMAYQDAPKQDGILYNYLRQRALEAVDIAERMAPNCTPQPTKLESEDVEDASISEGSDNGIDRKQQEAEDRAIYAKVVKICGFDLALLTKEEQTKARRKKWKDEWEKLEEKKPAKSGIPRIILLERLAVHTDEEAFAILTAQEQADDIRSQGGRLMRETGTCAGSGECPLCEVRRREPDRSLLSTKLRAPQFAQIRAFLADKLKVESNWTSFYDKSVKAYQKLAKDCQHAAHALGFLGRNSDDSLSATRRTFELLATEIGSQEERAILAICLAESPTVLAVPENDKASLRTVEAWRNYATNHTMKRKTKMSTIRQTWAEDAERRKTEAKAKLEKEVAYQSFKTVQNDRVLYYSSIPVDDLFDFCFVEQHSSDPETGYQRQLDEKRVEEMVAYLQVEGNSIPGAIILSARPVAEMEYRRESKSIFYQRVKGCFSVIDGQHRLNAYQRCPTRHRVPVAIYENLDRATEARLFHDLNTKGKNITGALIKSVKAVAGMESAQETFLRQLFNQLNSEGPWKGKLSATGGEFGKISRTTFDSAIGKAVKGALLSKGEPARQAELVNIYLRAVADTIEDKAQLSKAAFFGALADVMEAALRQSKLEFKNMRAESVAKVVERFKALTEADCTGTGKRAQLAERMRNCINPTEISDEEG